MCLFSRPDCMGNSDCIDMKRDGRGPSLPACLPAWGPARRPLLCMWGSQRSIHPGWLITLYEQYKQGGCLAALLGTAARTSDVASPLSNARSWLPGHRERQAPCFASHPLCPPTFTVRCMSIFIAFDSWPLSLGSRRDCGERE